MYDSQALQPGREEHNPSSFTSLSVVGTEPFLATSTQPTIHISNTILIGVPFSLLALWTIALVYFKQKTKQHAGFSNQARPKLYKRVPCRHCVFFKNNPYLKCAIRPVDVSTVNAIGCTDYVSKTADQHQA